VIMKTAVHIPPNDLSVVIDTVNPRAYGTGHVNLGAPMWRAVRFGY
jgi:hypothetical protein